MQAPLTSRRTIDSAVGPLAVGVADARLVEIGFGRQPDVGSPDEVISRASSQLREYLAGERRAFDLPLAAPRDGLLGRVLDELLTIPYGETVSYGELTRRLGLGGEHAREVGAALGRNPIPIVIPCHRVIGADGRLTGFGGGLDAKRRLLDVESPQLQLA